MKSVPVTVGFKAHLGWLASVTLVSDRAEVVAVRQDRLDVFSDASRAVKEPYHVAAGWDGLTRVERPPDPAAVVARGREQQVAITTQRFGEFRSELLTQGLRWKTVVMLTGRGRLEVGALPEAHTQVHVAEGEAVRDAVRASAASLGLDCLDLDEKTAIAGAAARCGVSIDQMIADLKAARPAQARSWAKEQLTIAAAAWLALQTG